MRDVQGSEPSEDRPGGVDVKSSIHETEIQIVELLAARGPLTASEIRPMLTNGDDLERAIARLRVNGRIRRAGYKRTAKRTARVWMLA